MADYDFTHNSTGICEFLDIDKPYNSKQGDRTC